MSRGLRGTGESNERFDGGSPETPAVQGRLAGDRRGGGRRFERHTVNLSPIGAKVRLEEELPVGSNARLRFRPPQGQPLDVDAVVWRSDFDGPAFFFVSVDDAAGRRG